MIYTFETVSQAYDATQCELPKGAIFVVPDEGVVGLSWTWPIAVTEAVGDEDSGQCVHGITAGYEKQVLADAGWSRQEIVAAVKEATDRGYPLADWAKEFVE